MKHYLLLVPFFLAVFTASAQKPKKDDKIDSKIEKSVEALANFLVKECTTEEDKVKAIHIWITHNIAYDYKLIEGDKSFKYESPSSVLKDKKALCTGYVRLMREMLAEVGILSVYVPGYTYAHKAHYKPKILLDNHAWIAIKINGEWKMADPTWDAGFIGSTAAEKMRQKLERKNEKIQKKNLKLIENQKDTLEALDVDSILSVKNPTGKPGFIFRPSEDWFLRDINEFTMRHLPANPMWQLREDIISVPDFLEADSTLKKILAKQEQKTFDFTTEIDSFLNKTFIEQIAFMGTDAYNFYSENKRVKAYYYYYFLSIIHEKEIQKQIKDFDLSQTYRLRRMVNQITDSTLYYAKLGGKIEKERYKALSGFYKTIDKSSQTNGKYFVKMATKNLGKNDKVILALNKKSEKLPGQIEKLQSAGGQYFKPNELQFEWIANKEVPPLVQTVVDSVEAIKMRWQTAVNTWEKRLESSPLQEVYNLVYFNNYLLERRLVFLGHKSIGFNDHIDTVDYLVKANLDTITSLYTTDIKEEMLLDDAYKTLKEMDAYQKSVVLELGKSNLTEPEQAELLRFANKQLVHMYSQQLVVAQDALAHNEWMLGGLQKLSNASSKFLKLAEAQEKFTLEKNEYLVEQAEHQHKREEDLADIIQKKVKIWKEKNQ